jgi:hypothetical protein
VGESVHDDAKYMGLEVRGFVSYLIHPNDEIVKVVNYSQNWHWLKNAEIKMRKGYNMRKWEGTSLAVAELANANKYLHRQYKRIEKKLTQKFKSVAIKIHHGQRKPLCLNRR